MLREYFGEILVQSPVRSGLPSGVRGVGADKFGLPSGVRGMPAVGWLSHWADTGELTAIATRAISSAFIIQPHRPTVVACPLKTDSMAACAHFSPSALETPIAPMTWPSSTTGSAPG